MQNETREELKQHAIKVIGIYPTNLQAARSEFIKGVTSRFNANSEGLTHDAYTSEAEKIWERMQAASRRASLARGQRDITSPEPLNTTST